MSKAVRENILDALAWAGCGEEARIARIANKIARGLDRYNDMPTKTYVKEEIRKTAPPRGRGKAIFEELWGDEATEGEIERQREIVLTRREARLSFERWQEEQAKHETRLNNAYAAAFSRPPYLPTRRLSHYEATYEQRQAFDAAERERDKGDECIALTHQDGHVVCLLKGYNGDSSEPHIAVRHKKGPITRTYFRCGSYECPENFAEAMVMLGGPRILSALAKGKRVKCDWVGRRFYVHHDGSDHIAPKVEVLPWLAADHRKGPWGWQGATTTKSFPIIVNGDDVTEDYAARDEDG